MVSMTKEPQVQLNKSTKQIDKFGEALHDALESIGNKFGVYQVMLKTGPITPACLATQVGITEKNARAWLDAQAARDYLKRSPSTNLYCVWNNFSVNNPGDELK